MDRSALQTFGFCVLPDETSLRRRYRELLFAHHPDRDLKATSNETTGQIIQAYRTLQKLLREREQTRDKKNSAASKSVWNSRATEPVSTQPRPTDSHRNQAFQLLRGSFGNVAVPLSVVESFVRAGDTEIANDCFRAIARHCDQTYVLFSPAGKTVSSRASIRWLLLLRTRERCALAFRQPPEINYAVPDRETLLLRQTGGAGTVLVGGILFQVPAIPGIEL